MQMCSRTAFKPAVCKVVGKPVKAWFIFAVGELWEPAWIRRDYAFPALLVALSVRTCDGNKSSLTFWSGQRGGERLVKWGDDQRDRGKRLPARRWGRRCTWGVRTALSSRPCRSPHRSYTAGRWSPSHSRARIAPGGGAMGETYTKAFSTSMQSNTTIY